MRIAHCIGCSCHDYRACHDEATGGPCSWLAVDYKAKLGVCSACPGHLARWDAGDRTAAGAGSQTTSNRSPVKR